MKAPSGWLITITLIYNDVVSAVSHVGTELGMLAIRARRPECSAHFGHPNTNGCELALASMNASLARGPNGRLATVLKFGSSQVVGTGRNDYQLPRSFAASK